jgi:hypothetical protein
MTKRKIVCQWAQDKKLLINPDGQAWPCCYLSNPAYTAKIQKARDGKVTYGYDVVGHPIIQEYYAFEDELNVFKNDLDDIVNHEWFVKTLPESWNHEKTTHKLCDMMCGEDEE